MSAISTNGNGRSSVWRRYGGQVAGLARFLQFSRDAALDRLRRTGPKAFVRDFPLLMRMGFNYYLAMRPGLGLTPPPMLPYDAWLAANRWTPGAQRLLSDRLTACRAALPKISVITPVHDPPVNFLNAAIASVVGQVYQDWELCIADDQSSNPQVHQALRQWAQKDSRIKLMFRAEHGHICRTTNAAAESATGEFLLFLDHDDELTPDALAEVALYAAQNPRTDFVYSDSDKMDTDGRRYDAEFKPDYSPELLLSYMYLTHLCAVRRSLFESIGGTRPGFEGSQDHDLALRTTERARHVGHIPLVLYHWRAIHGSTAVNGKAKPYSFTAGRTAVQEAIFRRGMDGAVIQPEWAKSGGLGIYAAEFPDDGPSVAILISTRNHLSALKKCLHSLKKTTYRNYQIVLIDNESDEAATRAFLDARLHRVLRISTGGDFNFAALNNRAAAQVDAEFILLLNNDTEVLEPKWLSRMVGHARAAGVGAVGARLLYPDGRVQHAGVVHGVSHGLAGNAFLHSARWENGALSHARLTRNYSAVTAACLLTPRKLYLEQGGLDEKQFPVAFGDCDYCYRLCDQGYRCVFVAGAELTHAERVTRGKGDPPRDVAAFREKFGGRADPFYNPNLSLDDAKFRVIPRRLPRAPVQPIRTLIFSHCLRLTGAPLIQFELSRALIGRNVIEPVVAAGRDGPLRREYENAGAPVHLLDEHQELPVLTRPQAYEQGVAALGRRMKEDWKVDLVYANTLPTAFAVDAASRVGIPVVWNIHESQGWQTFFGGYEPSIARKCLDCFARPYRVIFGSEATRQIYAPWNSAHNFTVLRNPLDPSRWTESTWTRQAARQSLGIAEDDFVLLTVGTLEPRKGQLDVVQALAHLPRDLRRRVRCYLVGDTSERYAQEVAAAISQLDDDLPRRVVMPGDTADVARYYRAADTFVCSSRIECYPRVTLEAMAFGLPMITTGVFGLVEQIPDGTCGRRYLASHADQLAEQIELLADDESLRLRMQNLGPVVLQSLGSFDWTVGQLGQILREAYLTGI